MARSADTVDKHLQPPVFRILVTLIPAPKSMTYPIVLVAMFWPTSVATYALPVKGRLLMPHMSRQVDATNLSLSAGNTQAIYTVVSLACIFSLAFMAGFQITAFRRQKAKFAKALVLIQTFLGVSFILSSALLVALGMDTLAQCQAATVICSVFYHGSKMALYLFLLERAHVIRAPFLKNRFHDWVWVLGIIIIVLGFGGLSIVRSVTRHTSFKNRECYIGNSTKVAYLILAFDAAINLALTALFVALLRPVLRFKQPESVTIFSGDVVSKTRSQRYLEKILFIGKERQETTNSRFWISIHALLWKNAIGSTLIFLASAANLIGIYVLGGVQLAWVCMASCMADMTFGILVVYWLTVGSSENEHNISQSTLDNPGSSISTMLSSVRGPASAQRNGSIAIVEYAQPSEKE